MAEDDIYGSKAKYERFKENLASLLVPPPKGIETRGHKKYYCRNSGNLDHFKRRFRHFEARDISYIRRLRVLQSMRLICYLTEKNLANLTRDDVDAMMAQIHRTYESSKSKETFISDLKHIYRTLFPEIDAKGRPDETVLPYVVRHLSRRIDRSRQKLRMNRLLWEEFDRIVDYFGNDPRIQAYLNMGIESLARPQELLCRRIGNVEQYDNYAKIYLTEHGKAVVQGSSALTLFVRSDLAYYRSAFCAAEILKNFLLWLRVQHLHHLAPPTPSTIKATTGLDCGATTPPIRARHPQGSKTGHFSI